MHNVCINTLELCVSSISKSVLDSKMAPNQVEKPSVRSSFLGKYLWKNNNGSFVNTNPRWKSLGNTKCIVARYIKQRLKDVKGLTINI